MVLLAGEAGIGKSRLTREIAKDARGHGWAVLTGRAVAGGVPAPFRPFAEALAASLRPGGLPEGAGLAPFLPALGRLIPHLQPEGSADGSLVFLGEAVLRLLRVLSPDHGCLLVVEDLHWADPETLALVEYLADNLVGERVLCVGTFRPDEGGDAAELAAKLETRGSAEVLALQRLDEGAVALILRACLAAVELPGPVRAFVAERAEGIPFLVEELLASLLEDGILVERDGRWQATGPVAARVPATFAGAVMRRLESAGLDSRRVIEAAAVLGRRFEWSLLSPMTGLGDDAVTMALRAGIKLQLIAARSNGFRFRHALTHEAVLAGLLPPEQARLAGLALGAVEAAQPGLPGAWCVVAADLAERSGDTTRAGALLLEAGRRDLAVGALVSAERTLVSARTLAGTGDAAVAIAVDEALTEVFAASGQVGRAIEMGHSLLPRLGASAPSRSADLHLQIARAAMAGGRWDDADASVRIARRLSPPGAARVDVCAAQVAVGREDLEGAARLAAAALRAAEDAGLPEVQCEALEVIGRVARQRDLEEAERVYARAESLASAHALQLPRLRAMAELASIEMLRTSKIDKLLEARRLSEELGALFVSAFLDLQLASALVKQFRAEEAMRTASACADASRRFHLLALPEALAFQAAAHAIRGEAEEMEARIAEALAAAPGDRDLLGGAWGRCRAMLSLLDEDLELAWEQMNTGAELTLASPAGPAPPFLGLWPLVGAILGRDADGAAARIRAGHLTRHRLIANLLGYTDAILAGREGQAAAAEAAFSAAEAQMSPEDAWYRHYARRIAGQAALADGWGHPVLWLREAAAFFAGRGHDRIAAACRGLLRRAGAPVPRRRPGDAALPERLRVLLVTAREAEVLGLVADGLTNREIAAQMFLSPRTVEKHVANLLVKTGLRRRAQLAGYFAGLNG